MLEIKVEQGCTSTHIKGNVAEICGDCVTAIHAVYDSIKEDDERSAKIFKDTFIEHVELAFCDLDELDKVLDEKHKKLKNLKAKTEESKKQDIKAMLLKMTEMLDGDNSLDDVIEFLEGEIRK